MRQQAAALHCTALPAAAPNCHPDALTVLMKKLNAATSPETHCNAYYVTQAKVHFGRKSVNWSLPRLSGDQGGSNCGGSELPGPPRSQFADLLPAWREKKHRGHLSRKPWKVVSPALPFAAVGNAHALNNVARMALKRSHAACGHGGRIVQSDVPGLVALTGDRQGTSLVMCCTSRWFCMQKVLFFEVNSRFGTTIAAPSIRGKTWHARYDLIVWTLPPA